jgi:hypothetical protein
MKTFEVKIAYAGYQVFRVQAADEFEAYQKAEENVGLGLFGPEAIPEIQTAFLETMNRVPEEDETTEVEPEAPLDEDQVTFNGPVGWPDKVLALDSDTFKND